MGFNKIRTIRVSERVFDIVCERLDDEQTGNYVKVDGWLETFNNCREQGYVLHMDSTDFKSDERTKDNLFIWVFECRNSDNIVVSWQTEYPTTNGMFSEETYRQRREYFSYAEYQKAADFIIKLVKKHFAHEFKGK